MPTSVALQTRAGFPCPPAVIADQHGPAWTSACANEAADRDFAARRSLATRAVRGPHERVAALLVAISHNNSHEGRDPRTIPDSLASGFVADLLGLRLTSLAGILVELQDRGLIVAAPAPGLRLIDLAGLESLAEAA